MISIGRIAIQMRIPLRVQLLEWVQISSLDTFSYSTHTTHTQPKWCLRISHLMLHIFRWFRFEFVKQNDFYPKVLRQLCKIAALTVEGSLRAWRTSERRRGWLGAMFFHPKTSWPRYDTPWHSVIVMINANCLSVVCLAPFSTMKPSLSSIIATGSDVRVPQRTSSSKEMLEKQRERIKKGPKVVESPWKVLKLERHWSVR